MREQPLISSDHTRNLFVADSASKILLVVIDGLGGLPHPRTGKTELETAALPHLDAMASTSSCGLISPLGPGITPGSGPAHLALFGYDPWRYRIGRGALSALGLDIDFRAGDVAARLNFCTVDRNGRIADRRAGRIPTEKARQLCSILEQVRIPGMEISISAEMEYRAAVVFRGDDLADAVTDSDPQATGVPPRPLEARSPAASRMVAVAGEFLRQARDLLAPEGPANMVLIRGFGRYPQLPQVADVYGLKALAVAGYPMYRGVAAATGMDAVDAGPDLESACRVLSERFPAYDFGYLHVKTTDSAGEDGAFDKKVDLLQDADACIPRLRELNPDVLIVTGDHSTPSTMGAHSWHPVPCALSSAWGIADAAARFSERGCRGGSLGTIPSTALMALALAHARRLEKFGA
jgi:2,3-bisphosphoglycerate-independent phosphoglycerate mutase